MNNNSHIESVFNDMLDDISYIKLNTYAIKKYNRILYK